MATTDWTTQSKRAGAYADVNGINLYYERHGSGRPLVLLHGGLESSEMLGPAIDDLAAGHEVVTVDLQGHGRTADVDRPISLVTMGDDIAALITHLGLDRPDVVGYSLGGGVAFQVAANHPEQVRKLVMVSTNIRRRAIYPEMLAQQGLVNANAMDNLKDTPLYQSYVRLAPRPEDFGRLLDKMGAAMAQDFDYSDQVRGLKVPTLFVAADADMFPPSHAVDVFALLDGGQRDGGWMGEGRPKGGHALAIVPGVTHYNILESPVLSRAVLAFLDAPEGQPAR
jgi:pimeloyl-ACP methyl ester carboxylesterase